MGRPGSGFEETSSASGDFICRYGGDSRRFIQSFEFAFRLGSACRVDRLGSRSGETNEPRCSVDPPVFPLVSPRRFTIQPIGPPRAHNRYCRSAAFTSLFQSGIPERRAEANDRECHWYVVPVARPRYSIRGPGILYFPGSVQCTGRFSGGCSIRGGPSFCLASPALRSPTELHRCHSLYERPKIPGSRMVLHDISTFFPDLSASDSGIIPAVEI